MQASYSFILTAEQFAGAALDRGARLPRPYRWAGTATVIALFAAFGVLLTSSLGRATVPGKVVFYAALGAMAAAILIGLLSRAATRAMLRRSTYIAGTPWTLTVEVEGLRERSATSDLFHGWAAYSRVDDRGGIVYLMLDDLSFFPVPHAAFESAAERDEFVRHVRAKIGEPAIADPPPPAAAIRERHGPRLAMDALRLAFFLKVPGERMAQSWAGVLGIAFLSILVPALPSLWEAGMGGEWSWYSMPAALFHLPLLLGASIAAAYAVGRPADVARILCAGLLASLAIDVLSMLISAAASGAPGSMRLAYLLRWLPGAWLAMALATFASRLIPRGERRLAIIAACAVLIALPLDNVYRDRALWHVPYEPEEAEGKSTRFGAAGEDAFYKQPVLLERELQSVRPGRKGRVDVFFIGMAGFGGQDVFMREIDSVAKMFRERFGSEGHIVRLVNNPRTVLDIPVASRTSLAAALKRVAEVMDRDEDVLVLFMTSHGSEDHHFSLSLWPLQFHEIDPAALRSLLDESGIKNRVVVISACYSGGFVKPLESPDTLVITASASNRNSFGCSNEADWTYFGKAYFDEALRKTHSFVGAFDLARPVIAEREKKENFDPSEPQISVGANIAAKLDELRSQLE